MTDNYGIIEEAIVTLLRTAPGFVWKNPEQQVTKSNDVYLDQGFDHHAITYPGAFPSSFGGTDVLTVQWEVLIDLLVRWKTSEEKAWIEFKSYRSKVFNLFNLSYKGRDLDRTPGVTNVTLTAPERPRYIPLNRDPDTDIVSHVAQVTVLTVTQAINKEY